MPIKTILSDFEHLKELLEENEAEIRRVIGKPDADQIHQLMSNLEGNLYLHRLLLEDPTALNANRKAKL